MTRHVYATTQLPEIQATAPSYWEVQSTPVPANAHPPQSDGSARRSQEKQERWTD
jgi:hypothetical protein